MRRGIEFAPFVLAALAAHVWAFGAVPQGARASGGDDGAQSISLSGGDIALQDLVQDWITPPEAATVSTPMQQAPAPLTALTAAAPDTAPPQWVMPTVPGLATGPARPTATAAPVVPGTLAPEPRKPKPAAAPKPRTAATPAQRAAGQGRAQTAGQAGKAPDSARASAASAGLVAQWGGAVRTAVLRQQRQPSARAQGTVHLQISLRSDGALLGVVLRKSSGHAALDAAALDAVRRARLPAAPKGITGTQNFNLPVTFRG